MHFFFIIDSRKVFSNEEIGLLFHDQIRRNNFLLHKIAHRNYNMVHQIPVDFFKERNRVTELVEIKHV